MAPNTQPHTSLNSEILMSEDLIADSDAFPPVGAGQKRNRRASMSDTEVDSSPVKPIKRTTLKGTGMLSSKHRTTPGEILPPRQPAWGTPKRPTVAQPTMEPETEDEEEGHLPSLDTVPATPIPPQSDNEVIKLLASQNTALTAQIGKLTDEVTAL